MRYQRSHLARFLGRLRKKMKLITVIPFNSSNYAAAERLCDCIYWLEDKQQIGACLLVAEHGTHEEFKTRVRIAAEVAFEHVEMIQLNESRNALISASKTMAKTFKFPWLWVEPECVPLKKGWRNELLLAYDSQPRRYIGAHLKQSNGSLALSRVAIYPNQCTADLSESLLPLSTKTRLIQALRFDGDESKIRPDAVLLYGDSTGKLIESVINRASASKIDVVFTEPSTETPTIIPDVPLSPVPQLKLDKRTKAYKDSLKKA